MADLPSINRFSLGDLIAGVSVALILIPQSLAYAEIAGLPGYVGLYTGALPPIVMALFTSSRYLQTGPVAMTSLLTFGILGALAPVGSFEYVKLASLLAVMVGVTRLLLGMLRGGRIVYLMTAPVMLGFTSAAALLIVASQIPRVLGTNSPDGKLLVEAWWALSHPGTWHWAALIMAVGAALIVLAGREIGTLFPGVLVAVVAAIVLSALSNFSGDTVGEIPTGLPPLSVDLPFDQIGSLLVGALVLALVGFAEPAAIARTFSEFDGEAWDASKELRASGLANIVSGFSGAYPIGGSFSRSSVNRLAGGRSRWAGAVTGLTVLAFLPFAGVLSPLPRSVLSAIIIVAVYKLVQIKALIRAVRRDALDGAVAMLTFFATLAIAPRVDRGILIGVVAGGLAAAWQRRANQQLDDQPSESEVVGD